MESQRIKEAWEIQEAIEKIKNDNILHMYRELMGRIIVNHIPAKIMANDGDIQDEPLPPLFYEYKEKYDERHKELCDRHGIECIKTHD